MTPWRRLFAIQKARALIRKYEAALELAHQLLAQLEQGRG
jgi:hypothetical protein